MKNVGHVSAKDFDIMPEVRSGFLWNNTTNSFTMTPFNNTPYGSPSNVFPSGGTVPFGINDSNQIVGDYLDATSGSRLGFLLSNGAYTTIQPPGARLPWQKGSITQVSSLEFTSLTRIVSMASCSEMVRTRRSMSLGH